MNLLPLTYLPGRLNAVPLALDGGGIRAMPDLANASYLTLSVVLYRSLRRAILPLLYPPLLFLPGVLANQPDRFSDLSFRFGAVEVSTLRWRTNGPVMELTVALTRWRILRRPITTQPGLVRPLPLGAALDLPGGHGAAQILMPALAP